MGNHFSPVNESKISASALVSANKSFECILLGKPPQRVEEVTLLQSAFLFAIYISFDAI
jgi:hypothetical protein